MSVGEQKFFYYRLEKAPSEHAISLLCHQCQTGPTRATWHLRSERDSLSLQVQCHGEQANIEIPCLSLVNAAVIVVFGTAGEGFELAVDRSVPPAPNEVP